MGFINTNGQNISYECSGLIKELKEDIIEFGEETFVNVWCTVRDGVELYVNYDFVEEDMPISKSEIKEDEYIKKINIVELLELMEQQNSIL